MLNFERTLLFRRVAGENDVCFGSKAAVALSGGRARDHIGGVYDPMT
jgi:hypothetical protein